MLELVLGALVAVAAVVFVAAPFIREPAPRDDTLAGPDPRERRRLALLEERDRALDALKELEFDHRTGKLSDEDYRSLVGRLRQRAAAALGALEPAAQNGRAHGIDPPEPAQVPEPAPPPDEADRPEPYAPPGEGDQPEPAPAVPSERDR